MATLTWFIYLPVLVTCLYVLYSIGLLVYNLFFSPLAKFPGPKIAAATHWYEFYYDFWLNGKYIYEIEKMHQKYGWSSPSNRISQIGILN